MKDRVKVDLELVGEAAFFMQMVQSQTSMTYVEIISKMMSLYKEVYLNDKELAWVEGSTIVQKLNADGLRKKT